MLQKVIFSFFVLCLCFQGPFFSKNSFGYPLFFRRVLKLCMFLLNKNLVLSNELIKVELPP